LEKERKDLRQALESESGSLRSQLQSHADSIKILVAEKADFEATVRKLNNELANKNGNSFFSFVRSPILEMAETYPAAKR
jgi:hypothetical protein